MAGASGFLGGQLRTAAAPTGHDVVRLVRRAPTGADAAPAGAGPEALDRPRRRRRRGGEPGRRRASRTSAGTTRTGASCVAAGSTRPRRSPRPSPRCRRGTGPACCSTPPRSASTATPATGRSTRTSPAGTGFFPDLCQRVGGRDRTGRARPAYGWCCCAPVSCSDARRRAAQADAARVPAVRRRHRWAAAGSGCRGSRWPTGSARCLPRWSRDESPVRSTWSGRTRCATRTSPARWAARCTGRRCRRCRGSRCGSCSASSPNEAVASQRVLPAVLNRAGFRFAHPDLDSALRSALQPA